MVLRFPALLVQLLKVIGVSSRLTNHLYDSETVAVDKTEGGVVHWECKIPVLVHVLECAFSQDPSHSLHGSFDAWIGRDVHIAIVVLQLLEPYSKSSQPAAYISMNLRLVLCLHWALLHVELPGAGAPLPT